MFKHKSVTLSSAFTQIDIHLLAFNYRKKNSFLIQNISLTKLTTTICSMAVPEA